MWLWVWVSALWIVSVKIQHHISSLIIIIIIVCRDSMTESIEEWTYEALNENRWPHDFFSTMPHWPDSVKKKHKKTFSITNVINVKFWGITCDTLILINKGNSIKRSISWRHMYNGHITTTLILKQLTVKLMNTYTETEWVVDIIICFMSTATRDTLKMTEKMAEAGADAVLVVTPCFYKASMNNDAMIAHYTKVVLCIA